MATLLNSIVGSICMGRTASNSNTTVRLGSCSSGTGNHKVAVGLYASCANSGAYNTAFGVCAMKTNTGGSNTGVGNSALFGGSGDCNTAVGDCSLFNLTSGECNTAVGYKTLCGLTSGSRNVGAGNFAGSTLTNGTNNVFIGHCANAFNSGVNNNVAVGYGARVGTYGNTAIGVNSQAVGYFAIAIGANSYSSYHIMWGGPQNSICNCIWGSWSYNSDCRDKTDIVDLDDNLGINLIRKLKPVSYKNDNRKSYVFKCDFEYGVKDGTLKNENRNYGFVAQELLESAEELNISLTAVKYNEIKDIYTVSYSQLLAPIVKTIQTIDNRIKTLKTKI
jgi:hypothetical protein